MFLRKGLPLLAIMVGIFVSNKSDAVIPPAKELLFKSLEKTRYFVYYTYKDLENSYFYLHKNKFSSEGNKIIVTVTDNQLNVKIVNKDGKKSKDSYIFGKTGSISCPISKDGFESLEKHLRLFSEWYCPDSERFKKQLTEILYFEIFKAAYLYLVDSKDQVVKNAFFDVMAECLSQFVFYFSLARTFDFAILESKALEPRETLEKVLIDHKLLDKK